jgi:hypothetical protein
MDADNGVLYGHIVTGSPETGVAYISPASQVFNRIAERLGGPLVLSRQQPIVPGSQLSSSSASHQETLVPATRLPSSSKRHNTVGEESELSLSLTRVTKRNELSRPPRLIGAFVDLSWVKKALIDQFENLVLQPLLEATSHQALELVIIIDALDECEQDADLRAILQLLSRVSGLKPLTLRTIVTSRPELHICLGFKRMSDGTYEQLVLQEVAKQTIKHGIRLFLEHELPLVQEQTRVARTT